MLVFGLVLVGVGFHFECRSVVGFVVPSVAGIASYHVICVGYCPLSAVKQVVGERHQQEPSCRKVPAEQVRGSMPEAPEDGS